MSTSNDKFLPQGAPLGLVDPCEVVATDAPSFGGARHEYVGLPIGGNDRKKAWLRVKFQKGAVKEHGVNGVQTEHLLRVVEDRLHDFQDGPFPCWQNELALAKVQEAIALMHHRTVERRNAGVEGTDAALPVPSVVDPLFDANWLKGELNDAAALLGMCAHDLGLQPDTGTTYAQLPEKLGPIARSLTAECYRMRKALADKGDHGDEDHEHAAAGCCFPVGPGRAGPGDDHADEVDKLMAANRNSRARDTAEMVFAGVVVAMLQGGRDLGRSRQEVLDEAASWAKDIGAYKVFPDDEAASV